MVTAGHGVATIANIEITKASHISMGCGTPNKVVEFIPDDQVEANIEKGANRKVLHGIRKL